MRLKTLTAALSRPVSHARSVARLVLGSLLVGLTFAGTLLGPTVLAHVRAERILTAGQWMEDEERFAPDVYPADSAIRYQIARALLNSYGGHRTHLVLTPDPCGNSTYYGCATVHSPDWARIEINANIEYSNIPKTVSHEYAHTLNTGRIFSMAEARLFEGHEINGKPSSPEEVLADCASQILTDFEYPWVVRSYLARACDSEQLALARELLSGEFVE
jgi:hypothetical protein